MDEKQDRWIQSWVNGKLHQMLSKRTLQVNNQDQRIQ